MKTLFYDNRQLSVLLILLVLVGGFSAVSSLPRSEDPYIRGRTGVIVTHLPGASAERIEALVTEKLEKELHEVAEIDNLESISRSGVSLITAELRADIVDIEPVWTDIRDRLAAAEAKLPEAAGKPHFDDTRGPWSFSLILGLRWDLDGESQPGILKRLADELAERLRNLDGTQLVRVYGEVDEEITVTLNPDRISDLGLTPAAISSSLARADSKISAGTVRGAERDLNVEVLGELDSLERVASVPIRLGGNGQLVRLGDVSRVERRPREPQTEVAIVDGESGLLLAARVEPDRRLDHWNSEALEIVDQFEKELSSGIGIKRIFLQNEYTEARLPDLIGNLLLGIAIVVAILFFSMGWRAALLVGSALPLSAAAVLFGLQLVGIPLHQMSITGLIIALGLLIDNAIVMVDEVRGRMSIGRPPREAIAESIEHLFVPLLGSTMTTVLAFLPILLLAGSVGEFVGSIAVSVILAILSSFFFAMTIVPTLAGYFRERHPVSKPWWQTGITSSRLTAAFSGLLEFLFRHPLAGLLVGLILPLLGFILAPTLPNQFFPPADRDQFYVQLWMESDSSLEHTRQEALRVEAILREHPGIESVDWLVGASAPTFYYNMLMNQDGSSRYAHGLVRATSYDVVRQAVPQLQSRIDRRLVRSQVVLRLLGQGPPVDAPLELRIFGPSMTRLRALGDEVRLQLSLMPEVLHSRARLRRREPKLWIAASEDEARQSGLSLSEVANQINDGLEGRFGGSLLEQTEEMTIRLRYHDEGRSRADGIDSLNLVGLEGGPWVPLSGLGRTELRPELESIPHRNNQRVNVIKVYLAADALPPHVTQEFLRRLQDSGFSLPMGYRMEVGGEAEEQQEATANLLVYIPVLAVLMVATLVLSFGSFALSGVIGLVALLSLGLGLFAIWVSGYAWGFMSMIGTAGLVGVAINDSIVVLAALRSHTGGGSLAVPVLASSRHVISTTLTTAGGFVPLILSGGDFWPPLAVVIAGGVLGATLIALIFTPAAYTLLEPHAAGHSRQDKQSVGSSEGQLAVA